MHTALRPNVLCSFFVATAIAGSAHAITDPAQSPPPPNGNVVVMGQAGVQQQPVQVVQPPPPPRLGIWAQGRIGGGLEWHGLVGPGTAGARGNAFAMIAGGYTMPNGVGFSLYGGGRYLFSPICDNVRNCTGAPGSGVVDVEIGILVRYTALAQARLHPIAEAGGQIHILPIAAGLGFGYGGQLSLGLEFDVTANFSIDLLARGQLFVTGWPTPMRDLLGFRVEPMLGATLYW
jgi:hypothetical protein